MHKFFLKIGYNYLPFRFDKGGIFQGISLYQGEGGNLYSTGPMFRVLVEMLKMLMAEQT